MKLGDLTPVQKSGDIWLKRDDLFMPFPDIPLSGGKVRQCLALVENNLDYIRNQCGNTIATISSVESPQGVIASAIAKKYGIKCIVGIGTSASLDKVLKTHNLVKLSYDLGADIRILAKLGYDQVLTARLLKSQIDNGEKFFFIKFGLSLEDSPEAILLTIADQVKNIPDDVENVIVPAGSCITFSGIAIGLTRNHWFDNPNHKLIGIQIAGINRSDVIDRILTRELGAMMTVPYELHLDKTYPYSRNVDASIGDVKLDPIYEAKACVYMNTHLNNLPNKLFWIVGDSSKIRGFSFQV